VAWLIGSSWVEHDEKNQNNFAGYDVRSFPNLADFICTACVQGKLITRPPLLMICDE
jgi:hypothetical protein